MKGLGTRIKMIRASKGWTQERLAEEAQVSQGSVSAYERDDRSGIPLAHVMRIADALTVPLQFLAYGSEVSPSVASLYDGSESAEVHSPFNKSAS